MIILTVKSTKNVGFLLAYNHCLGLKWEAHLGILWIKKINLPRDLPVFIHLFLHPSTNSWYLWHQSAIYRCWSINQPSFSFISQYFAYGFKCKPNGWNISSSWKGEITFLTICIVLWSGRPDWWRLSFPRCAPSLSHDEPYADSFWGAIDPPLGSPSGHHLKASLARAYLGYYRAEQRKPVLSGEHTLSLELSCLPDNILFSRAAKTEEISKSKRKSMDVGFIRLIE